MSVSNRTANNTGTSITITTSANAQYLVVFYYLSGTDTLTEQAILDSIMIEKGSTATTYEPHQEQTAQLNLGDLEYSAKGDYKDKFMKPSGSNLFNSFIINADYTQISGDGTINVSGTLSENGYTTTGKMLKELCPNLKVGDVAYLYLETDFYYNGNLRNLIYVGESWNKNTSKTITEAMLNRNVIVYGGYNTTSHIKIMITKDKLASEYEPYNNNKWYLKKKIGKVVLDENSSISVQEMISSNNKFIWRYTNALNMAGSGSRANILSNYYIGDTGVYGANDKIGAYVNSNNITNFATLLSTIGATTSSTTSQALELLKTWLTSNNVTLYYPLATPTYIPLNDTLQSQLEYIYNQMLAYKGQTNISQINNGLPFIIDSTALKDLTSL